MHFLKAANPADLLYAATPSWLVSGFKKTFNNSMQNYLFKNIIILFFPCVF